VTQWIQDHVSGQSSSAPETVTKPPSSTRHRASDSWHAPSQPQEDTRYPVPGLVWASTPAVPDSQRVGLVEVDTATARPSLTLRAVTDKRRDTARRNHPGLTRAPRKQWIVSRNGQRPWKGGGLRARRWQA